MLTSSRDWTRTSNRPINSHTHHAPPLEDPHPQGRHASGWESRAACALAVAQGYPLDLWHADPTDKRSIATALSVCRACPVTAECLAACLQLPGPASRYGIWGGLTPAARGRL